MLSAKMKKTVGKVITCAVLVAGEPLLHRPSGLDGEKFSLMTPVEFYGAGEMGSG